MADNNPNPNDANANNNAGAQDGANNNANQGGGNNQGQGGNQNNGNGAGNANQNQNNGGNQGAGGDDYKKKFGESTTENQRLMQVLKDAGIDPKTGKKIEGAGDGGNANAGNNNGTGDVPYFTDDELEATFPSFATMTDQEKQVLRQVGSFPKMARMVAEMHDKLTFNEQLEVIKADPANKLIADNEKEFKAFAYQDNNLKLPLEMLKDAFIGKTLREANNGGGNNAGGNGGGDNNQNQNRQGMENGTGGQGGAGDAVMEMTAEQARDLRKKEPRKYNALARAGKLKIIAGN